MEYKNDIVNNNYDLHNGKHYSSSTSVVDKNIEKDDHSIEMTTISIASQNVITKKEPILVCTPDICRKHKETHNPDLENNGAWNRTKTYIFMAAVSGFIIWCIVYAVVTKFGLV